MLRSRRKVGFISLVVVMLVLLVMGCSKPPVEQSGSTQQPQATAPYSKDEVVVIQGQLNMTSLDPQITSAENMVSVLSNMFEPMVINMGIEKGYIPCLATSWEKIDTLTWIFHLRDDVVFHNGEKFNAAAMKFTLDRCLRPDIMVQHVSNFSTIDRFEVVDDYTLRIVTKVEDPLILLKMSSRPAKAIPPAYIASVGEDQFGLAPVGTGPYKFVRCDAGRDLYMEASPTYWGPAPVIKKARFREIPEAGARMAEFQSGRADIVDSVPYDLLERLVADPALDVINSWTVRTVYLQLDCEAPPTDNKLVRQAIAHSIDMDSLIEFLLLGNGRRMASFSIPEVAYHDPDLKPWTYDVELAKQLVGQTGLTPPLAVTFDVTYGRVPMDKELCEAIAAMLNETGLFNVTLVINESGIYGDKYNKPGLPRTMGQIILSTHGNQTGDPDFTLDRSFTYIDPPRTMIASHQKDRELHNLIKQAGVELNDAKRREMNYELQRRIMDDCGRVYLYQQRSPWGVNAHLNWTPNGEMIEAWTMSWK